MIYKILGPFVNPLTADDRYSLLNRDKKNKRKTKRKIFARFFFAFPTFRFNFEHFQEKDDPHSSCIFQVTESEKLG